MKNNIFGENIDLAIRLDPNELWRRITATSDAKKIVFFAPSGFEGDKRFLYTVSGSEIKVNLRQRQKGIPPILTMRIEQANYGCRIIGRIAVEKSSWIFLTGFFAIFFAIGTAVLSSVIGKLAAGQSFASLTPFDWIPLLFIPGALKVLLKIFLKVKRDQTEILEWLKNIIADSAIKI